MKKLKIFAVLSLFVIGALAGFTACKGDLVAPTEFDIDLDNVLTWEDVETARSYVVEIKNVANGEITEHTSRRETMSLAYLDVGDYEIRIKSVGSDEEDTSDWSEALHFYRAYETGCVYKLINNNTEYEITDNGRSKGHVVIENEYRGKPVTSIAKKAFQRAGNLESIVIGENVKSIGDNAFYNCTGLTSVTLPKSLTTLGTAAFQGCKKLTEIKIPDNVTVIPDYAFAYCSELKTVELPSAITSIGDSSFYQCTSVTSWEIPDAVKSIASNAFANNAALKTLSLGAGLETIGESAFQCAMFDSSLETVTFAENSSLKTILGYAFADNKVLSEIALPSGLEYLEYRVFQSCEKLGTVTIPDSVTHVGYEAFKNTKLYTDAVNNNDDYIYADKWLIERSDNVKDTLEKVTAATLKAGTVGIANYAFSYSKSLLQVALPDSVKIIGRYAFQGCEKLWKVETNKAEMIDEWAFAECPVLSNMILNKGLKTIGGYAFYNCGQLYNPSIGTLIPDSVTKIGTFAFYKTGLWNSPEDNGVVYAGNWVVGFNPQELITEALTLKASTVGISDYAFYQAGMIKSIMGIAYAQYIGMGAFYGCSGLSSVTLNRNLRVIEDYTFYKCESLYSVGMPARLESIGRSAFYKCERLNEMDLSDSQVETIAPYAFYNCTSLKTLDLGNDLISVGERAFYKCTSLTELSIPDSVQKIDLKAFYGNSALTTLILGEGVQEIGDYAFHRCEALTSIKLPDSVKTLGRNAFYKCTSVTELELGAGLEKIGDFAFYGLEKVEKLTIPAKVTVGKYAFKGCSSVTSLLLKKDTAVNDYAFYGCSSMTVYTDAASKEDVAWGNRWNISYLPVVWGCTLSEDGSYVVSVTIQDTTLGNKNTGKVFTAPQREGYTFLGWKTQGSDKVEYTASEIVSAPVNTTLYAVWELTNEVTE